ncbi:hypothetical protein [Methylovorus mays]|uniref:hypothetical protein n=1 Tax=Methylovorus mays TaxID=184077 RepID=UPI001E4414AB|nr:hypothetical protein [Methylovorus mays]MCB5207472.1 hypothetical protein [Methylovorus mays]
MKKHLSLLAFLSVSFPAIANDNTPTIRVETNLGKGCHIAATLPKGEHSGIGSWEQHLGAFHVEPLPASWKSNMGEMYFSRECMDSNHPELMQPSGILNPTTKKWEKDPDYLRSYLTTSTDAHAREKIEEIIETMQVYDIKAVNGHGWADTHIYLNGDQQTRQGYMRFCIFHASKALCGHGAVGYVSIPDSDLTQHAIEILRTIEFLPDVPAAELVKP